MKSVILATSLTRCPSRKAPLSRLSRPRARSSDSRSFQSLLEQEILCRGATARRIILTMEKFMNEFEVMDDADRRAPDLGWHLGAPGLVAGDADAVAW